MMPSNCHKGWTQTASAADSEIVLSDLSQEFSVPEFAADCADGIAQEDKESDDPQNNFNCVKWGNERAENSWTCNSLSVSEGTACSSEFEKLGAESLCSCPSCQKTFCIIVDELDTCIDDSEQYNTTLKSNACEGAAESDICYTYSLGNNSKEPRDIACATASNFHAEQHEVKNGHNPPRMLVHQNGASSHTLTSTVMYFSDRNSREEGKAYQCLSSVCESAPLMTDRTVADESVSETHVSGCETTVESDSACILQEQRKQLHSPRKNNSNSNADTENVFPDSRNSARLSTTGMSEHDQVQLGVSTAQDSDQVSSDNSAVEHPLWNVGCEQQTVAETSSSDLHGQAQSLCLWSEGCSSRDIDSLPASELASLQSGLSLELVSSLESVDNLPLLSAISLDQNCCELSEESCFNRETDSLSLVNAIQLDRRQPGLCEEQSSLKCTSPEMAVDINKIPDEVLLKVFAFLSPAELCNHVTSVCKRWHRLAYDHSLWRKLDVSNIRLSGFQLCQIVLCTSGGIRYLDMSGVEHLSNAEMAVVAENCPDLIHLDIGFVNDFNCTMLYAVLTSCPRLEFLNMEGCRHANNEMMRVLAGSAGPRLKRLNFSHCSLVDESLWLMMQHIHGLTHLNIDGISWISELVVQHLASEYCTTLESWELDGNELTDSTIYSLSLCHQLKVLSISFCENLTDQSLRHLRGLEYLQKLTFRKGYSCSAPALTEFLSSSNLQNLTYLDLTECQQLDDEGVQAIAKTCGQKLETLCLSWCWDVTDKGMEHIASACKQMVRMYLVGLHRLEGLWLATTVQTMPDLIYISFEQCNEVVDSVIEEAVRRKHDLVLLNYYGEVFMHKSLPV